MCIYIYMHTVYGQSFVVRSLRNDDRLLGGHVELELEGVVAGELYRKGFDRLTSIMDPYSSCTCTWIFVHVHLLFFIMRMFSLFIHVSMIYANLHR